VQQARRKVEIGFWEYFRVGALITIITIVVGIAVLALEVRLAHGSEALAAEKTEQQVTVTPGDEAAAPRTFRIALLCDSPEARVQGLQGFRQLRPGEAALFVFEKPEAVLFWMGSVPYPIDIIFVSPDKKVRRVFSSCRPGSLDQFPSGGQVKWVIETAAGSGVKAGDRIGINTSRND